MWIYHRLFTGNWVASAFWLLWIKLLWYSCACLLEELSSHFCLVCIGERNRVYIYIGLACGAEHFSKMVVPIYTPISNIRDPLAPYEEVSGLEDNNRPS